MREICHMVTERSLKWKIREKRYFIHEIADVVHINIILEILLL